MKYYLVRNDCNSDVYVNDSVQPGVELIDSTEADSYEQACALLISKRLIFTGEQTTQNKVDLSQPLAWKKFMGFREYELTVFDKDNL